MSSNLKDERVLVTGASGYIAAHIVKLLLESGYRVRGTVRDLKNTKKVAPLKALASSTTCHELELCEADLLDANSWPNAVRECSYVIHTASPFPSEIPSDESLICGPAVDGTLNVLKACVLQDNQAMVKRVVLTSSVAAIAGDVFGNGRIYNENDWPDIKKLNPYPKR